MWNAPIQPLGQSAVSIFAEWTDFSDGTIRHRIKQGSAFIGLRMNRLGCTFIVNLYMYKGVAFHCFIWVGGGLSNVMTKADNSICGCCVVHPRVRSKAIASRSKWFGLGFGMGIRMLVDVAAYRLSNTLGLNFLMWHSLSENKATKVWTLRRTTGRKSY